MSGIEQVEWEPPLLQPGHDAALEREVRQALGFVPSWVPYFHHCPWAVRGAVEYLCAPLAYVDDELSEMVALVVSQDNGCRYCYAINRTVMRVLGVSEARIRKLEQNLFTAGLDPRTRAALDFARRLSRANPMPGAADRELLLDAGFDDGAFREIAFLAATNVLANRTATLPAIPPQPLERIPESWLFRVARPLLGVVFRRRNRRGPRRPLPREAETGPFGYLFAHLRDIPAAYALHVFIEGAWQSPYLPRRAKALVFAIVARGLGCPLSEREAGGLLAAEGLDAAELEHILTHAGSPELDPVESVSISFARETIHYRPAQIQRLGRAVLQHLSEDAFVDLVSTAALANQICRLSVITLSGARS